MKFRGTGLLVPLMLSFFASPAFASSIKVATYNVWALPRPLLRHPERLTKLPEAIRALDADVLLFQEAFSGEARSLESIPGYPHVARGRKGGFLKFGSGLLIVSRFPILETAVLSYSRCGGLDCFSRKGAQYARILVPDQGPVSVFNTHWNANSHAEVRLGQARELALFIRRHAGISPFIVGGDFNAQPGEESLATLKIALGLVDALDGRLSAWTADFRRNPYLRGRRNSGSRRIDHLFADGSGALILREAGIELDGERQPVLSDHFAISATYELGPGRD